MIRIYCEAADAVLKETQTLTAGMTNYPECVLTFSDDWDGFGKAVVVRAGEVEKSVLVVNNKFTVPHECLANSGVNLIVGVSGTNGTQTIPTIWCSCGTIMDSVDINESAGTGTATPSLVDQMIAYAQQISDYAEELDQNVIRSVEVNNVNADKYGVASVGISDTGASENRTITFTFANLKGKGIEEMIFIPDGTNKNRLQIKFSDNTYLNYDGIKDAIASMDSLESAIEAAETLRVAAEELRVSAEEARVVDETNRENAESGRADAETLRAASEVIRADNEAARVSAEESRATAETTRQGNESTRQSNENLRIQQETNRVSAENDRAQAESARDNAETARNTAESDRAFAESNRASAESVRASAESSRVTAENNRSSAESTRASNEQTRVSNEQTRISNETTRQSNEATRQSNESGRVSAESERVTAEDERAEAETQREAGYSRLLTEFEEVKDTVDTFDDKLLDVYPVVNASNAIASFSDGADNIPVEKLVVNIEPVQSGTGDPSPTNIRPITGWTGAKVTRAGKNLLPPSVNSGSIQDLGVTFYSNNGELYIEGTATGNGGRLTFLTTPFQLQAGPYTISCQTNYQLVVYNMNGAIIANTFGPNIAYFTLNSAQSVYVGVNVIKDIVYTGVAKFMLVIGSTPADYEPYQGDTYDITFPSEAGTVYGGTLDLVSGRLTVENFYISFLGSESFNENTSAWGNLAKLYNTEVPILPSFKNPAICSHFQKSSYGGWSLIEKNNFIIAGNTYIGFGWDGTIEELKSYLSEQSQSGTPVQVVAKLATPITYQLTPIEIATLLGDNNIWADTGDTSVDYRADIKLYIQNHTKPTEDDMVANENIAANKFFMLNNTLYFSTAAIASGATIIPGTNCNVVSLADALNTINT